MKSHTLFSIFIFISCIAFFLILNLKKSDMYTNRIVEDINTHKRYIQEINDLVNVGDTITCKIDGTWITIKVIK